MEASVGVRIAYACFYPSCASMGRMKQGRHALSMGVLKHCFNEGAPRVSGGAVDIKNNLRKK